MCSLTLPPPPQGESEAREGEEKPRIRFTMAGRVPNVRDPVCLLFRKGLFSFVWCVYAQDQGNRVVNWNIMKSHLRQSLDIESLERKERLVEGLIVITVLNVISPKST